ncbi:MAG: DUF599 domain-containing protein [Sulfitobacter sp.]
MDLLDRITLFQALDIGAFVLLVLFWAGIGWRIENSPDHYPSVSSIMAKYRGEWMRQMVTREPRIFDAQTLGSLRQGTSFFASTCVIAIGGTLALIGNADRLAGVAEDLTLISHTARVLEVKLLVLVLFLTNAFLKFVWANRLFGYCSVLVASVPNDANDPACYHRAHQAAEINVTAARSFNRGLRSIFFALSVVAWLAGPIALIAASFFTLCVIWRREFASESRKILLKEQ